MVRLSNLEEKPDFEWTATGINSPLKGLTKALKEMRSALEQEKNILKKKREDLLKKAVSDPLDTSFRGEKSNG